MCQIYIKAIYLSYPFLQHDFWYKLSELLLLCVTAPKLVGVTPGPCGHLLSFISTQGTQHHPWPRWADSDFSVLKIKKADPLSVSQFGFWFGIWFWNMLNNMFDPFYWLTGWCFPLNPSSQIYASIGRRIILHYYFKILFINMFQLH